MLLDFLCDAQSKTLLDFSFLSRLFTIKTDADFLFSSFNFDRVFTQSTQFTENQLHDFLINGRHSH